jgi:VCBS repeat-containing protein
MRQSRTPLCLAILVASLASSSFAISPPDRAPVPDFDRRRANFATEGSSPQTAAAAETIRSRVRDARVAQDGVTGAPRFIASTRGFLSGPNGEGSAVPARAARGFAANDKNRGLRAFLTEHRALFGHGAEALNTARVKREYTDAHNGLRTAVWQQELDGVPLFQAVLKAHTTARGELVNIASGFVPDPAAAAEKGTPGRAARLAKPAISAAQAVVIAATGAGEAVALGELSAVDAASGAAKRQRFKHRALADVAAEFVWLPTDRNSLRLCWQVIFTSNARGEMFLVLVDAETGEAQVRRGLTHYVSEATYNVFPSDSPTPFSPGHGAPSNGQPAAVSRTLVTLSALDLTASPNGWIDDGVNETRGNNVDAHTDLDANNLPDLPRPQGSPFRVFNPPLDLTQSPASNRDAAVVQLFYLNNLIHDRLYQLGFTEAAGNFQNNNFGRGGIGNDAVQADAQDGSGMNNANFSTPPDGSPGRMQMFIFSGPNPNRDGDFDAEIVIHEYVHGLSNRLVGGGVGISALQPAGMGEGWSDFYALCLLSEPGDAADGNFAAGAYASYQLGGLTENYYYGIRRYPYSTDLTRNPLTFKDIDPAKAGTHANVPRSPVIGNTANEVHNIGEVWCVTLWDARARLVARHGHAIGNELMLRLVTDGMKLSPANPTFLEARDAILQADAVNNGGANRNDLWAAFARRGMGASAVAPGSNTTSGVIEAFDLPDSLDISPRTGLVSSGSAGGPFTPARLDFTVSNSGATPLDWTASRLQPWLSVSPSAGTLAPGESAMVVARLNATASALGIGDHSDTITFFNNATGALQTRTVTLSVLPARVQMFDLDTDPGWTRQGEWEFGVPAGRGGANYGTPDPTSGATGTSVFGVNLNGDYSTVGGGPFHLTTGALDLSDRQQTRLRFRRWLNTDFRPYATARVEVSRDGANWTQLFENPVGSSITDAAWQTVDYNISGVADRQPTVFVRWSYAITSGAFPYSGWNIDDVEILGNSSQTVRVTLPASGTEGAGPLTGTVTASPAPASDLIVALTSTDTTELTVPAMVVIPAGAVSATFSAEIVSDGELDGSQTVFVAPSAAGYSAIPGSTVIHDQSTTTLGLILPESLTEGTPTALGSVTLADVPASDVAVRLISSHPGNLQVPQNVVVPAGHTSAAFPLTAPDNDVLDGTRAVTITADVVGWAPANRAVAIIDNDIPVLALVLPAQVSEGAGTVSGTITLSGTVATPLTVTLTSDNTSAATVASSIVVPANARTASFTVRITNNDIVDGVKTATITATANGFPPASKSIAVLNDDADHYGIATIPSPQFAGAPFTILVTAFDENHQPMSNFTKSLNVTASAGGSALTVTPAAIGGFRNGVFTGSVAIKPPAKDVVITVRDDTGRTATSNAINLVGGVPDYFTEVFVTDNDVAHQSFLFVPTGTLDGYVVRRQPATAFFTDPTGGTPLFLGDDTFAEVKPENGKTLLLYDVRYPSLFVGSNGYVTFGAGDTEYNESFATHFAARRIAALMDDLNPLEGGQISVKHLQDRIAVTWLGVPEFGAKTPNNFQIEVFFDGRIRITLLDIAAVDGAIGLSRGGGVPPNFIESDFIKYPTQCPPTLSELNDVVINEDRTTPAMEFTVFDVETAAAELSLTASSSNPALVPPGSIVLGGSGANRTVQITPAPNRSGTAVVTLTVTDGSALATSANFAITVNPVNDPPTFTSGGDVTVNEDAGLQTVVAWATAISAGPEEASQAINFEVANDHPALFATPPAVAPDGTLTFQPARDAFGTANVTVQLRDDGGTANGGIDRSATQTFAIHVRPVNDPPSFAAGPAQVVNEDSGTRSVAHWAAAISPGPANEAGQSVAFIVGNDAPELFSVQPAIAPDGTLTFTPAPDAFGSATITIRAQDDGGSADGGIDESPPQVLAIQVLPVNDPPTLAAIGGIEVPEDSAPHVIPLAGIGTGAANEVQPLTVRAVSSNPALVPHPLVNYTSPNASGALTIIVTGDMSGSATITVTVDDGQSENHATSQSFEVVVRGVNDAPTFTAGPSQTVLEDSGLHSVAGWASGISAGPPDEAGQALHFTTTTDNEALFSRQPAVAPDGTLTFQSAPDANGEASVTVILRDGGGTDGGGVDASPAQRFTIRVTPVNDAPTFSHAGSLSVAQDAGPQVLNRFVHSISRGAENESDQSVTFFVSTDQPTLFAVPPQISRLGTLSFVPRPEASGTATVTVRLRDNGGTENGGVDTSETKSFKIAVTTFQEETGTYNGLALPAADAVAGAEKTGLLRVTIGRGGAFTGRLRLGTGSFPLRGVFDNAGVPHFFPLRATTASLSRKGAAPLILDLRLDVSAGTDRLTGTLTEGESHFAEITADRALYTQAKHRRPPLRVLAPELTGPYTAIFAGRRTTQAAPAATKFPLGDGFARLTVTASGATRMAGRLADGSAVSYSNALSKDNVFPVWVPFAGGKGALAGPVTFRDVPGISDVDGPELLWFKPAKANAEAYPAGWPEGMPLDLVGSKFILPPRGSGRSVFPGLDAAATAGNALVQIADESTAPPILTIPIRIDPRDQVLVLEPRGENFRASITPSTGWFRGSFTDTGSDRATKFHGAILQKQRRASGYFAAPAANGLITIQPTAPPAAE